MRAASPYIAPIAVVTLFSMATIVITMTIMAANARPKNLEACIDYAYRSHGQAVAYEERNYISEAVYRDRRASIDAALSDNLMACKATYE